MVEGTPKPRKRQNVPVVVGGGIAALAQGLALLFGSSTETAVAIGQAGALIGSLALLLTRHGS